MTSFAEIHRIFLDHCIVLFRGQKLTREQHVAFSRRFGELDDNDRSPDTDPQFPELSIVTTRPKADGKPSESRYTGQVWHSDISAGVSIELSPRKFPEQLPRERRFVQQTFAVGNLGAVDPHAMHADRIRGQPWRSPGKIKHAALGSAAHGVGVK